MNIDLQDVLAKFTGTSQEDIDPEFAERDQLPMDQNQALTKEWHKQLQAEAKAHKDFRQDARKAEKHYHNESVTAGGSNAVDDNFYPAFYNCVQIQMAVLYGGDPVPDVRRRFPDAFDQDPSRSGDEQISLAIQRGISYALDTSSSFQDFAEAVEDFSVSALGVTRVTREEGKIGVERWAWSAFRWEPSPKWKDVDWIAFDHFLTPKEIHRQFKIDPQLIGTGSGTEELPDIDDGSKNDKRIRITEIMHRPTRKVLIVADGCKQLLDYYSDPWGIEGFYPCAQPMMFGCKSGELIPKPEMFQFRKLINQIHRLTKRCDTLEKSLKDVTFYDSALGDIWGKVQDAGDGAYIPLDSILDQLIAAGGAPLDLNHVIARLPFADRAILFERISAERDKLLVALEQAMGIADIMAGMSNPNEAEGTQHLKSDWGSARMRRKRQIVNSHIRGTIRIMADMVASLDPQTMYQITGVPLTEEQYAQMQDDRLRSYAIDIESDSTAIQTRYRDQMARGEVIGAISNVLERALPLVQAGQLPAQTMQELLLFGVRGMPAARSLEDSLGQMAQYNDHMTQMHQQFEQMQGDYDSLAQEHEELRIAFGMAQQELGKRTETEAAEDVASVEQKLAAAEKARAEADKVRSDTVIQNNAQIVELGSSADELAEGVAWDAGWRSQQ